MIIIDTDVLSIHHIFTNDKRYKTNEEFLLSNKEGFGTTIFNLLELCGILVTAGNKEQVEQLYNTYLSSTEISLLMPTISGIDTEILWQKISKQILEVIKKGVRLGDASILWICEECKAEYLITWNIKHYKGKTSIKCLTPKEFLDCFKK